MSDEKKNFNLLGRFSKTSNSNFMKIRLMGAELFHADGRTDGQTDMKKLTDTFSNFGNTPKNYFLNNISCLINFFLHYFEGLKA